MIEVGNLTYAYRGKTVLKNASMRVGNGRFYVIFGLHGSGKSTLLSLMAGARELQSGVVRINGFDLLKEAVPAKKCLGYCPQEAAYYPSMTVYELLNFVAQAKAVREDQRFIRVHELMESYGLEELKDRRIAALGAMELFRLGLAQALVGGSEILLLDAPTMGLSYADALEARRMLGELTKKGKTVFLATESAQEALELADEILLLRSGRLSAPVAKEELFESLDLDALDETESALYAAAEKTVVPDREDETAEKEDEA